ncbi:NUDIX domain-containing protein [Sutcliffiella horikoshii]|uniref:NUDIX domain-containing protein n=1 Tax=Sutcliffiella horikoshii TaxID=79883 RepID=UPI001CFEA64F|nr:NUDIX hydrolase [Sutcliffiella horikoshii]
MEVRQAVGAIVTIGKEYILILKTKINTTEGKKEIQGEWDFIKGGVEKTDSSLYEAILRELKEETGKNTFYVIKEFEEKISFKFPQGVAKKIGYHSQETTMFLVEYKGENKDLLPQDDEVSEIGFFKKEEVQRKLAHEETRQYFKKHCLN